MDEQIFNRTECGKRIKALRQHNNLSQEEFALLVHISQSNLSKIEKGVSSPSLDVLFHMRRNFGVSIDYILYGRTAVPEEIFQRLKKLHNLLAEIEKELTFMQTFHAVMNTFHSTFKTF